MTGESDAGTSLIPDGLSETMSGRPADDLLASAGRDGGQGIDGDSWLRRLPRLVTAALERWQLTPDGAAHHGICALVLPVRRDERPAALKLTWPHLEARTEHLALRHWAGRGSVRLLTADPASWTLLLERLDASRDLSQEPIDDACAAIGGLLAELDVPGIPAVPRLESYAARAADAFAAAPPAVPRRFVEQARSLLRDLSAAGASREASGRLLHTDLHFANVLARQREGLEQRHGARAQWLAIDPKPMTGDRAFEVAPVLWNRWDEAVESRDVRGHLRRRVQIVCEHAGIDEDRARGWAVVRDVHNAIDAVADGDPYGVTVAVAVVKAMSG